MQLTSVLVPILAALGAVNAAPAEEINEELQQIPPPALLQLHQLPNMQGATFTGVGIPGECNNLPRNIFDFGSAEAAPGFVCTIYTNPGCTGSTLTVGARQGGLFRLVTPTWRSWRCVCRS